MTRILSKIEGSRVIVTILLPFTIELVKVRRFGLAGDTQDGTRPEGLDGN